MSVDEIHDALTQGSFAFETSGVENQKNSIRISLGKNSAAFVRLPNSDMFGLCDWYGVRTRQRPRKAANGSEASPATAPAESGETTAEAPAEASSVTEDK